MKKRSVFKLLSYWFDCMMSRGAAAMCGLLLLICAAIVGGIGILAYFTADDGGMLFQLWQSLMHALDAGNLAGVQTGNKLYLLLMSASTICGLFLTSVLIGFIANGVEQKFTSLRKGNSVIQEKNHTIIIGFDNDIHAILSELIEANANKKRECIVVLGEQDKILMEDEIATHNPDTKTTRIICRSGKLYEAYALERCSVETAKSVIINVHEDTEAIKILLGLANYVRGKKLTNDKLHFVLTLEDKKNGKVAEIASEKRAAIIYIQDTIARIIANTCRQHGLSQVLTELFNFSGNEIYYENIPALVGKNFGQAVMSFSNAIAIGVARGKDIKLNPGKDVLIKEGDKIILIEEDDGAYKYHSPKRGNDRKLKKGDASPVKATDNILVLGSNDKLKTILSEYSSYVRKGTRVVIVDDDMNMEELGTHNTLDIETWDKGVTEEYLRNVIENEEMKNILLLNDDSSDSETSDAQTLFRLILLRKIADEMKEDFSITTEMRNSSSQRLASQARVDDFVIGSNFASLMMAQISENPDLIPLIKEILDDQGSELYMKEVSDYVPLGETVDSYDISESALQKGEVYIGYRRNKENVVVNPNKEEKLVFKKGDQIVVIAEGNNVEGENAI